jgi:aminopeptidase N
MKTKPIIPQLFGVTAGLVLLAVSAVAQQPAPTAPASRFDITNYHIEAQLIPDQHLLRAGADVTFTPQEPTRSVVFELNGSLHVDSVERDGAPLTNYVQDAVGVGALGPSVRVDLGAVVPTGQTVVLRFRWSGALVSPEGGPLTTKRLAYVGSEGSYLMYAARWFPFHNYAADRATSDITLIVPTGFQVVGASDEAVTPQQQGKDGTTRYRFVQTRPGLPGNFAVAQYISRTLRLGNFEIQFNTKPGSEGRINAFAEPMLHVFEFYTKQYGLPTNGTKLIVAQTDDETIDAYSGAGIMMLASKLFDAGRAVSDEKLAREVAYQWWGQTVGLKSFDDAWLSQGLAEWSAFTYREATLTGGPLDAMQREEQERALTFEQTASIGRAPAVLDDQSAAYQSIIYYKGAMVFRMLRDTLGPDKFNQLLRTFVEKFRDKNVSVDEFERLTSQLAGENMRYFFAQWIEGTGVPEFTVDYQIIRTRAGKFRTRGTVKQNFEGLKMPVELMLRAEDNNQTTTVRLESKSEDFDFESNGSPIEVIVDPNNRILRMSDDLRISVIARRGIEQMKEGNYSEAQQQLEAALKLDRSNSWVYYNLGLLFFEQRNWQQSLDNFDAALHGNLKPSWIEVWARIRRGNSYDAQGNREKAVYEYKQAEQSGIDYDHAQQAVKKFLATPFDPKAAQTAELASPGTN